MKIQSGHYSGQIQMNRDIGQNLTRITTLYSRLILHAVPPDSFKPEVFASVELIF
jgi:hypothetical protein